MRAYFGTGMAQAGKSGTTTLNRDALFAGFTPYYTCVVWGGYDDNSIQSATGYPKNLWKAVMKRIHADLRQKILKSLPELHRLLSVQNPDFCRKRMSVIKTHVERKVIRNILQKERFRPRTVIIIFFCRFVRHREKLPENTVRQIRL